MSPLDSSHPNLHLGQGRSRRNEQRRQQLLALLAWRDPDDPQAPPLTFAEIAEVMGITRERVRVLAKREGVVGRVKARQAGKVVRRLRGQRRWFGKDGGDGKDGSGSSDSSSADEKGPL